MSQRKGLPSPEDLAGAFDAMPEVDIKEILRNQKQETDDRRTLSGKYAPRPGVCRVCSGKVVATVGFDHHGRIGGPPVQGHVSGWHCEGCEIVYRVRPPEAP